MTKRRLATSGMKVTQRWSANVPFQMLMQFVFAIFF